MTLPARTRDYIGPVTDTRIWDRFQLRDDDIILSTPPKCGTTWSQAILMMLIHENPATDRQIWRDSVWLDCGIRDQVEAKATLDAQSHQRCIKSHTPFDGIPCNPQATYITVYRHPIDVHFSMMKHVANMKLDVLDFLNPPEPGAAFARFLDAPATDSGTDDLTLAAMIHHYNSFAKWAHLPNVHLFHYADLSADLPACIRAYARAAGLSPTEQLVAEIANAASFGAMKETTRLHDDGSGAFKVQHAFFDSAASNKWKGRLSQSELDAYHERISDLASPEDINFLENGDGIE